MSSKPIVLWTPKATLTSDEACTSIIQYSLAPPPSAIPTPYHSQATSPSQTSLSYVPPLAFFCIRALVEYVDQLHTLGPFRRPYQSPADGHDFDILQALIPSYRPHSSHHSEFDLRVVDPRLWAAIAQIFENLPEEGGKRNTNGGKMEEAVLKSLKGTLDIVCLHLSDPLFDLVLYLVYDYATTNAKSNAVRAFGQLVACLARVKPEKVIAKFLPFCINQVQEELKHGASSIRTTSTHAAVPSDTTLHWSKFI